MNAKVASRAELAGHNDSGRWTIDPATSAARFSMKYMLFATLKGSLGSIEGAIIIDEESPQRSTVTASIDVATLSTGIRLRDTHLRSGDFFDVTRFPTITFRSVRVDRLGERNLCVFGDLTIRGITKRIELATAYESVANVGADASRRAAFMATATLSRRAFGLGRRSVERGGIASDTVHVSLQIVAAQASGLHNTPGVSGSAGLALLRPTRPVA